MTEKYRDPLLARIAAVRETRELHASNEVHRAYWIGLEDAYKEALIAYDKRAQDQ